MPLVRLNKYLSQAGACSRREADRFAGEGRILVNGKAGLPGQMVEPGKDEVLLDGRRILPNHHKVVLAYHKPAGIVCSTKDQGGEHNNIIDAVHFPERVFPVGRLDKDSTGLILLTNDGELSQWLLKGENHHEKEYEVELDRMLKEEEIRQMRKGGIPIEEGRPTRPIRTDHLGRRCYRLVLTEGMNREIRKVAEYFGCRVRRLKRVRFARIRLGELKEGEYRILTEKEMEALKRPWKNTKN
ncbi:MAG: rRNA pseudouridine synthase [Lachnospiraceae bacterium]|nr:rRNA pseudouridine synthase [Lachnospiraceae bacterium]